MPCKVPSIFQQMRNHEKRVNAQRAKQGLPPRPSFLSPENIKKALEQAQQIINGDIPKGSK